MVKPDFGGSGTLATANTDESLSSDQLRLTDSDLERIAAYAATRFASLDRGVELDARGNLARTFKALLVERYVSDYKVTLMSRLGGMGSSNFKNAVSQLRKRGVAIVTGKGIDTGAEGTGAYPKYFMDTRFKRQMILEALGTDELAGKTTDKLQSKMEPSKLADAFRAQFAHKQFWVLSKGAIEHLAKDVEDVKALYGRSQNIPEFAAAIGQQFQMSADAVEDLSQVIDASSHEMDVFILSSENYKKLLSASDMLFWEHKGFDFRNENAWRRAPYMPPTPMRS